MTISAFDRFKVGIAGQGDQDAARDRGGHEGQVQGDGQGRPWRSTSSSADGGAPAAAWSSAGKDLLTALLRRIGFYF
jgi:hypothetical protein